MVRGGSWSNVDCCLNENIIYLDLDVFKFSWCEVSQEWIELRSCSIVSRLLLEVRGWRSRISSAKRNTFDVEESERLGRSLTKIRKRRGPSIEPCGTPEVTESGEESELLTLTCCFLSVRYEWNQPVSLSWLYGQTKGFPASSEQWQSWYCRSQPFYRVCKAF